MRKIKNSLRHALEIFVSDFVKEYCQNNRRREAYDKVQTVQHNGIAQGNLEILHRENLLERIKADKLCFFKSADNVII